MVRRELHDERSRLAGEHLRFLEHDTRDDDSSHTDEVSARRDPRGVAEDSARDHRDERHLSAAGDEGGGHDGHTAVALVLDGTGCHDAGNAAAGADEHRNEGFAGETELSEDTVKDERDTGHVAARLKSRKQEEQDEHLRDEAEHRADTGDDTVKDKSGEPFGSVCRLKTVSYEYRYTGYPDTEVGRVGSVEAVCLKVADGVGVGGHYRVILAGVSGNGRIVDGHVGLCEGLFILNSDSAGGVVRLGDISFDLVKSGSRVEIVGLGVNPDESVDRVERVAVLAVGFLISAGADAEQVPAVSEQSVVRPICSRGTDSHHRDVVNEEHDGDEDRETEPAVGDDTVDLIGGRELPGVLLLVARLDYRGDIYVSLVGDDRLGVVVELFLDRLYVVLDVVENRLVELQLRYGLVVALEDLYRVPALTLFG